MIEICAERTGESAAIRTVHQQAFHPSPNDEARLVELLRRAGRMTFSLVAVHEELVVGHAAFSPVTIVPAPVTLIRGSRSGRSASSPRTSGKASAPGWSARGWKPAGRAATAP